MNCASTPYSRHSAAHTRFVRWLFRSANSRLPDAPVVAVSSRSTAAIVPGPVTGQVQSITVTEPCAHTTDRSALSPESAIFERSCNIRPPEDMAKQQRQQRRRPKPVLTLKVSGPDIASGRIPVPDLLVICQHAQSAVNRQ